jgi:hypothetical protein
MFAFCGLGLNLVRAETKHVEADRNKLMNGE